MTFTREQVALLARLLDGAAKYHRRESVSALMLGARLEYQEHQDLAVGADALREQMEAALAGEVGNTTEGA